MSTTLDELKLLIINHSNEFWTSIENGTSILNALQSLLKAAKYKSNDNWTLTPSVHDSEGFQTSKESNCCVNSGGAGDETRNNDDYIGSDMDNSEEDVTEENYLTADEGYDVSEFS